MIVEDLPTGQVWVFVLNIAVSFFFQLVGFLLTYLMHTSHAAKFGSRAGLGMTLIQLGFYSRTLGPEGENEEVGWQSVPVDSSKDIPVPADDSLTTESPIISDGVMKDWLSFMLMTMGKYSDVIHSKSLRAESECRRLVSSPHFCCWLLESKTVGTIHQKVYACSSSCLNSD